MKDDTITSTIGNRMKAVRSTVGVTQTLFASNLSTTQSFLSAIEKDKTPPTESILNMISLNYGVNKEWLRSGKGEMFNEGYMYVLATNTIRSTSIINYTLLTQIIMYIEKYLVDNNKKATPEAKARFIANFYKYFVDNYNSPTQRDVKQRIESSFDVLATVLG